MSFAQQSYTVTEGGAVNVTLVTSTSDYEFDFTVTLEPSEGSATGESCSLTCTVQDLALQNSSSLCHSSSMKVEMLTVVGCNSYLLFPTFHLTAGSDFTPGPYTVSFSAGQPYAILMVSPIDDDIADPLEYFTLMITSVDRPDVVEIGSPNTSVITIVDDEPRMSATFCDVAENAFIHNTTLYM